MLAEESDTNRFAAGEASAALRLNVAHGLGPPVVPGSAFTPAAVSSAPRRAFLWTYRHHQTNIENESQYRIEMLPGDIRPVKSPFGGWSSSLRRLFPERLVQARQDLGVPLQEQVFVNHSVAEVRGHASEPVNRVRK